MKLELKHLAAYLPYELRYKDVPDGFKFERVLTIHTIDWCLENGKPILRPLSDLTKEIEHNGEKFVPIEVLSKYTTLELEDDVLYQADFNGEMVETEIMGLAYFQIAQLFEWKFDIFGLIEHGLAIDINQLNT